MCFVSAVCVGVVAATPSLREVVFRAAARTRRLNGRDDGEVSVVRIALTPYPVW